MSTNGSPAPFPAPMTLRELAQKAHATAKSKGWYEGHQSSLPVHDHPARYALEWNRGLFHPSRMAVLPRPLFHHTNALIDEISEAWRAICTDEPALHTAVQYRDGKPVGLATELADVIVVCGDLAQYWHIDLADETHKEIATDLKRTEGPLAVMDFGMPDLNLAALETYGRRRLLDSWVAQRSAEGPATPAMYSHFIDALYRRVATVRAATDREISTPLSLHESDPFPDAKRALGDIVRITSITAALAQAPLVEALEVKLAYNATRPYKHGKRG